MKKKDRIPLSGVKKRRCIICGKLTSRWQRINGGYWHCYDGCYETTGVDIRKK